MAEHDCTEAALNELVRVARKSERDLTISKLDQILDDAEYLGILSFYAHQDIKAKLREMLRAEV